MPRPRSGAITVWVYVHLRSLLSAFMRVHALWPNVASGCAFIPTQLLAQHREVAIALRMQQRRRAGRRGYGDHVAGLELPERLDVEVGARVHAAHQRDLDLGGGAD